jgi:hypothetical protein
MEDLSETTKDLNRILVYGDKSNIPTKRWFPMAKPCVSTVQVGYTSILDSLGS